MPEWVEKLGRVVTVEPVIFWFMTSTFIVSPAYQQLIINKICSELFQDQSICANLGQHHDEDKEVQRHSSTVVLLYLVVLSVVSVPPALLLGSWSDRVGRRSVMVLPSALSMAAGAVLVCMHELPQMGVMWVLAAAAIVGLTGGHVSIFLSCFSYLADVTAGCPGEGRTRTVRMAVAESMIFVGGTLGFLMGGFLEKAYGLTAAFGAFMVCHVIIILYVLLWLRDPRPPPSSPVPQDAITKQDDDDAEAAKPPGSQLFLVRYLKRTLYSVFKKRPGQERQKLLFLILCSFLNNLVAVGESAILLLYLMYEPREFDTEMFGIFSSVKMLLLGGCLLGLFPLLLRCMGEMTLAKLSMVFRAASFILLAFSTNTWMVFLVAVLGAPAGINQAVIRSLSSAIVEPDEQGAMFSFTASAEATCFLFAAIIFSGLYPLTLPTFPGMPFIVMAGFCLIVLVLTQWVSEMQPTQPRLVIQ
ncbi:proton-coupled folate transporter [Sardina pilchardus]|uniref:proton-coupled folate transporter n=1 Tax=Sardina pilchardus TaxID=27697 RepID=UPI002E0EAEE1